MENISASQKLLRNESERTICTLPSHKPPLCNTGVQKILKTSKSADSTMQINENLKLTIDWFECTFKTLKYYEVLEAFGLSYEHILKTDKGMHGYDKTFYIDETIKIMINTQDWKRGENEQMGTHLVMSGKGCREFEKKYDWHSLFLYCVSNNAIVSRIDIAFDSFTDSYFTVQKAKKALQNDCICTKSKTCQIHEKCSISGGEVIGETLMIGTAQSETQICIYNKLQERTSAEEAIPENIEHWYRCELRMRHDTALNFLYLTSQEWESFTSNCISVLYNYLDFKIEADKHLPKTKRRTVNWWNAFIKDSAKIQLSKKDKVSTIERKKQWIEKSVVKSLAMCVLSDLDNEIDPKDILNVYYKHGVEKIKSEMDKHLIINPN